MDLAERKKFSQDKLKKIKTKIKRLEIIKKFPNLCIFVCGSFGRKEASEKSDLDLFFVNYDIGKGSEKIPNQLDDILLRAELIKVIRKLKIPDFSNEGEFLQFHSLREILENLGGPKDDFENYFTTRMLLILESAPVYGEDLYEKIIGKIVDSYFRDYKGHEGKFFPLFLLNDIVRFWKTLCLNYENKRNDEKINDPEKKEKHCLKNFKLKFSRMLICYSMIVSLSSKQGRPKNKNEVIDLIKLTPLDRLEKVARNHKVLDIYWRVKNLYSFYLGEVSRENIKSRLLDDKHKAKVFKKAENFSNEMYQLLLKVSDDASRKNLII